MEQKQTAVEFIVAELENICGLDISTDMAIYIIEQAKQMEKQQKMECWETAHQAGRFEGKGIAEENWQTFEQYYNTEYAKTPNN